MGRHRREPTSGDSFSIGLGDYFTNLVEPQTASMAVTYNGQVTEVGTCTLDKTTATCTFNGKIDELKAAGFTSFKGTTSALLLVIGQTTSETTQMTVNGNAVDVDLPGTGGIRPHDPVEWHMSKVGSSSARTPGTSTGRSTSGRTTSPSSSRA